MGQNMVLGFHPSAIVITSFSTYNIERVIDGVLLATKNKLSGIPGSKEYVQVKHFKHESLVKSYNMYITLFYAESSC